MTEVLKRERGRPTKYHPKYCREVIACGKKGLSLTAFAGMIEVARQTISEWMNSHEEFSAAVKIHAAVRTEYLERSMLSMENGPGVTARIFALKNAAPGEWRDKQIHEHSVSLTLADLVLGSMDRPSQETAK